MSNIETSKSLKYIINQLSKLPDTERVTIFYRESTKGSEKVDFTLLGNFDSKEICAIELIKLMEKLKIDFIVKEFVDSLNIANEFGYKLTDLDSEDFDQFLKVCEFIETVGYGLDDEIDNK